MTGRVSQRGDGLSVSAELIDVSDNRVLWGQQYSRKLTDLIAVQEEISREISDKLRLKLSGEDQKRLTKRYTDNTEAYQLYLKGRYHWNKRTEDGYRRGIEQFQLAIEKDPNYALAFSGMADCYLLRGRFGTVPPNETMARAKSAVMRALELDDQLAEAHTSLSYIKKDYDWNFSGAEAELKRAIELNPNYATAHFWYAVLLAETFGKHDEAMARIKRAAELDPTSLIISTDMGMLLYLARRYDQAIAQCQTALEMDPNFFRARLWLGRSFERKGMYQEAIAELQKARELDDRPIVSAFLGQTYAAAGRASEARRVIEELEQLAKQSYVDSYYLASIHLALGDKDRAFQSLEQAYLERSSWMSRLKTDPIFDAARTDARFQDLLRRIGFPES
jgi:tetratricopeptide (TPR) repeat protein